MLNRDKQQSHRRDCSVHFPAWIVLIQRPLLFWSCCSGGGKMKKTELGVWGSLALAEFRVGTLFLVRFKRRVSADPSICSYVPEINVPYLMKLTSLYLSLTEGREDNLFLLPMQTPPAQCYIALCFPGFAARRHRCGLKRSWASVSTGFPPFLRIFCKPVVEPQSFLLGPYKQERTCPPASEDAVLAGDSCFGVNPALLTRQSTFGRLPSGVTRAGGWQRRCAALPAVLADADQVN